jgi:geranylgeranyl pyrophosphate synthase
MHRGHAPGGVAVSAQEKLLANVEELVAEAGDLREWITWTDDLPELQLGGKRARARLLLATAASLGVLGEPAAVLAATVEMIHNASLFHDDVIDNADLRRGAPTLHSQNGNRFAIMTGDLCFARAMQLITRLDNLEIYRRVGQAVVDLAAGQLAESTPGPANGGLEHYYRIVDRKTGSLLSLCVGLPGVLADLPPDQKDGLFRAGELLGRAFQIADDMLDLSSDTEHTGKDALRDLHEGRLTWPYLTMLELAAPSQRKILQAVLDDAGTATPTTLRQMAQEVGLFDHVRRCLDDHLAQARILVENVPRWQDGKAFFQVCSALAHRTR